jgi:hypothetical protein
VTFLPSPGDDYDRSDSAKHFKGIFHSVRAAPGDKEDSLDWRPRVGRAEHPKVVHANDIFIQIATAFFVFLCNELEDSASDKASSETPLRSLLGCRSRRALVIEFVRRDG